jgi:YVTN family beta-propeller protein
VIDGADLSTETVEVGFQPGSVAVDTVRNRVYVANKVNGDVTVIDGADLSSRRTVGVGDWPTALAINPVTNRVYVVNRDSNNVTVIDGTDFSTRTVEVGISPWAVAVNPVTNRAYVVNWISDDVTVIDGSDLSTRTVPGGDGPVAVAVNSVTNRAYVASPAGVTVIDGADFSTRTVPTSGGFGAVVVNPVTNRVFAAQWRGTVAVIRDPAVESIPLTVEITHLGDRNISHFDTAALMFEATSEFAPTAPPPLQIYFQVDTWMDAWIPATPAGASGTAITPPQLPGTHVVYAFATDGQGASSTHTSPGGSPLVGQIAALPIVFIPEPGRWLLSTSALASVALVAWLRRRRHAALERRSSFVLN